MPTVAGDRAFCTEQAAAIRLLGRRVVADIIEIGQRLIAVKDRLQHGAWLVWPDREFGWSERTARNYMEGAKRFSSIKSATVADFAQLTIDVSAVYLLSAPSTPMPMPVREEAVARAAEGTLVDGRNRLHSSPASNCNSSILPSMTTRRR